MNSSTLRRLAADHSSLHSSPLPPHYLFPLSAGVPDDLTQLTILLTGPQGTPYSQGLWKLHLKIPEDYPKSPPKAAFKTRIWHPNVEEASGSVCVDTLKRDWESKLTLRDVLITISCLLIQPNPDSALNSTAGHLLQEDYEAFSRQAKLMTSIHARIPPELKDAVEAAKQRGEEAGTERKEDTKARPSMIRKPASTSGVTMKKPPHLTIAQSDSASRSISAPVSRPQATDDSSDDEVENDENDPSLSPSPVTIPTTSPRRPTLPKRPLSDLPTPVEPESDDDDRGLHLSPSEKNIAANAPFFPTTASTSTTNSQQEEQQGVFKLAERRRSVNFSNTRSQQDNSSSMIRPFEDAEDADEGDRPKKRVCSAEGKENYGEAVAALPSPPMVEPSRAASLGNSIAPDPVVAGVTVRKVSTAAKAKGRVGLRRL